MTMKLYLGIIKDYTKASYWSAVRWLHDALGRYIARHEIKSMHILEVGYHDNNKTEIYAAGRDIQRHTTIIK